MASSKILVVDDQPINVQLLKRKLEREGMTIATAYSGQEALNLVAADKPDLILLDVMMPDMDGIEVCQRLQADHETKSIPIIFITARTSKEGKIEGLGVGAVDYITKPIDLDETLARVQTQLRFVQINRELVDLQRRLGDSRRTATIGAVTQGIAHNLNNLLGVVIGYVDLIKAYNEKPELVRKNAAHLEDAVNRIVAIIKQLTTLIEKLDEQLQTLITEEADLAAKATDLQTATGVGTQTATVLLAHFPELGTLSRQATAAIAGLAPHPQESGSWTGKRRIYGGRATVRKALDMAPKSAAQHCPHLAPFYKRLREDGKKADNVALIAVARKLLIRLNTPLKQLKIQTPNAALAT